MHVSTNMSGSTMAFPNVCLTPAPPAPNPIPVPYPSLAQCAQALCGTFSMRVTILNKNVLTTNTIVPMTTGDQPGINGGVTSGLFGNVCKRIQSSLKVFVEGTPLVRNLDMIASNGPSPNAPVGNQLAPSQVKVICIA
jgi:hypothetical protein